MEGRMLVLEASVISCKIYSILIVLHLFYSFLVRVLLKQPGFFKSGFTGHETVPVENYVSQNGKASVALFSKVSLLGQSGLCFP